MGDFVIVKVVRRSWGLWCCHGGGVALCNSYPLGLAQLPHTKLKGAQLACRIDLPREAFMLGEICYRLIGTGRFMVQNPPASA